MRLGGKLKVNNLAGPAFGHVILLKLLGLWSDCRLEVSQRNQGLSNRCSHGLRVSQNS